MVTFGLTILDVNRMFPTWVMFCTYLNTHAKLWYLMDLVILLVFGITFHVMGMVRVVHGVISYRYVLITFRPRRKGFILTFSP